MLEVADLDVAYGEKPALRGVAMRVGKGSAFRSWGRTARGSPRSSAPSPDCSSPAGERSRWTVGRLDQLPAYEIAGLGIAHVPEGRRVLPDMTVEENLELGAFLPGPKKQRRRDPGLGVRGVPAAPGAAAAAGRNPVRRASSRCWPSGAGLMLRPRHPDAGRAVARAWRRSSWTSPSRRSPRSGGRGSPSSWWSRTCSGPSA